MVKNTAGHKEYLGQCHCGAVQFTITKAPNALIDCNCSICRRLGALWAHVPIANVTIEASDNGTIQYAQGDKTLAVHTCKTCGCTTHYESLQEEGEVMAVNFRMCAPEVVDEFEIRKFDGADTWTFLSS